MRANADKDYIDAKTEAVRTGLEGRLDAFQASVDARFTSFQAAVDARFTQFEAAVNTRFSTFEASVNTRFSEFEASVNIRFAEVNAKIDRLGAELRQELAEHTTRIVQWMVGLFLATVVLFITVITFVLNNAIPKAQPVAGTPAVIIQLPPGATVLPAAPAATPKP